MKRYSYSLAYILLMAVPASILLLFVGNSLNPKALLIEIFVSFLVGGVFCIWAEQQGKKDKFYIWKYNPKTVLNKKLLGVEVEDFLIFLFLTPIFSVALWEAAKKFVSASNFPIGIMAMIGVSILVIAYGITYHLAKPQKRKKKR